MYHTIATLLSDLPDLPDSGDRAYHIKWRVQETFVDGLKPKLVSILAGINDIRGLALGEGLSVSIINGPFPAIIETIVLS